MKTIHYQMNSVLEEFNKVLKRDRRDGLSMVAYEWLFAKDAITAHDEELPDGSRPYDAWKQYNANLGYTLKEVIELNLGHGNSGKLIVYTNEKHEMRIDPLALALGYLKADNERVIVEVTFSDSYYKQTKNHRLN